MDLVVVHHVDGHRLDGDGPITEIANRFLDHLGSRGFSPATVRGYAYDLLNFSRFLTERRLELAGVVASDIFAWLDWQAKRPAGGPAKVVRLADRRGPAPATGEPARGRGSGLVRVRGDLRRPGRQPCPSGPARHRDAARSRRTARSRRRWPPAARRPAGAPASPAARQRRAGRGRCVPVGPRYPPRPSSGVADGAGGTAGSGGPLGAPG